MNTLLNRLNFHLSTNTQNIKLGVEDMATTTTSRETCPNDCPFKRTDKVNGCYADNFPLSVHWDRVTDKTRGVKFKEFLKQLKALSKNKNLRLSQAGDLVLDDESNISEEYLNKIIRHTKHLKSVWTYTHHNLENSAINRARVIKATNQGLVINYSTQSLFKADKAFNSGLLPVTVIRSDNEKLEVFKKNKKTYYKLTKKITTPEGRRCVLCPAQQFENVNCSNCKLCNSKDRDYVILFAVHGNQSKKANQTFEEV